MAVGNCFWKVQAEDFRENTLGRVIVVYNCFSKQSLCNLTKRMTLPLLFPGEIFQNGWLWTAASEQSRIAACNFIRFLRIKIFFRILYKITLNVNIDFLKIATSQPIVSKEQAWPWSLEIRIEKIFNYLIKQNQKLGSDSVLQQSTTMSRVQSPDSSMQSPESRVQRPASRVQHLVSRVRI